MKAHVFVAAIAGILLSIGTAFAYHPMDRNLRGTLDPEQLERIESEHVQRGWLAGRSSTAAARQPTRPAQRGTSPVPFATEHHTR
jgi:hypothetical protein